MSIITAPSPRFSLLLALVFMTILLPGCTTLLTTASTKGSIHQVGLVWLKDAGSAADAEKIIAAVHSFARDIPEVQSAAVGRPHAPGGSFSDSSYDVCFTLVFQDEAARLRYNTHPVHEKAAREVFLPLSRKFLFYRFAGE